MKKIDLGQTITILANVGVIAGIVFLAFELRQNNTFLAEQARNEFGDDIAQLNEAIYLNSGGLATLLVKAPSGSELTVEERLRLDVFALQNLLGWQKVFGAVENGILDETEINPGGGWTTVYYDLIPNSDEVFDRNRPGLNPRFVEYVDSSVAVR